MNLKFHNCIGFVASLFNRQLINNFRFFFLDFRWDTNSTWFTETKYARTHKENASIVDANEYSDTKHYCW